MKEYICIESPNEVEGGMLVRKQELIRCKDCAEWKVSRGIEKNYCRKIGYVVGEDDFCSKAEPKGTEQ